MSRRAARPRARCARAARRLGATVVRAPATSSLLVASALAASALAMSLLAVPAPATSTLAAPSPPTPSAAITVDDASAAPSAVGPSALAASEPPSRTTGATADDAPAAPLPRSTAFYLAADPPIALLAPFERIVVDPAAVDAETLGALAAHGARLFARLPLGSGARKTLLRRAEALARRGFAGLYLDAGADATARGSDIARSVDALASGLPDLALIADERIGTDSPALRRLEAIVARGLFADGRDDADGTSDRAARAAALHAVIAAGGPEVIALEEVAPGRRERAREIARAAAAEGFVPWVAGAALDSVGVGLLEPMPREVLMLHDSRLEDSEMLPAVHRLLAMPLEYHGYVPRLLDLAREALPTLPLAGRVAGVVYRHGHGAAAPTLAPWLGAQLDAGVPVALLGAPQSLFDAANASRTGLARVAAPVGETLRIVRRDVLVGFEREPHPRLETGAHALRSVAPDNRVHLAVADARGRHADLVVTGPWGGYALDPAVIDVDLDGIGYWTIDPFAFLSRALSLEPMPQPDVTSAGGRRLWMAHIDGDALPSWAEMPGRRLGAEVVASRILEHHRLPHTVSVIEAEMTRLPTVGDRRARMFEVARRIFALPQVEIASHTFSHPYRWRLAETDAPGLHHLPLPGYRYSAEREVDGSVGFIDRTLAPQGKRTEVMLWSGDALPGAAALAATRRLGLANVNGGNTVITRDRPTVSLVSAMAREVEGELQVYAPIMNENVYTGDWTGPFDGFRRVIETFEMTERPRRLKPIDIYYHFYAGTKIATMRALEEIYAHTLEQDIHPLPLSEYARMVGTFREVGVARTLDGRWRLYAPGPIRSVRLLDHGRWPDLADARGIAGVRALHDGLYLTTTGARTLEFATTTSPPTTPHIVSTNGRVIRWQTTAGKVRLRLAAHVPAEVELGGLGGAGPCRAVGTDGDTPADGVVGDDTVGERGADGHVRFRFDSEDTGLVTIDCAA